MKNIFLLLLFALPALTVCAQSDQHYTMFMYNKLLYNPGYTGTRDAVSINGLYRNQWTAIEGSPKTMSLSVDGPVGNYMKPFRKVAVGLSIGNEKTGVETNTFAKAYYAYRLKFAHSVLSLGLSAGGTFYSAAYNKLTLYQQNDPNFSGNVKNNVLPNFGAGAYWSGSDFYAGLSVPNMLENRYDKNEASLLSRQIRAVYLSGGYSFQANSYIRLQPQVLARYATNANYSLPFNADINISVIAYEQLLIGITYRTDNSIEGIIHIQATRKINIGYAYDYKMSGIAAAIGGAHEIVLGYDFVKDNSKFLTPRFIRKF